jgi:hypothetical protein
VNGIFGITCLVLFLATAPALLVVRLARPARMPWWLIGILAASLGWVLSNLAVYFYYEQLGALLAQAGGGAPQELIDEWQNDGAKRVFAFMFGWLYGLIYLAPWLVAYGVLQAVRRVASKRRRAAANSGVI